MSTFEWRVSVAPVRALGLLALVCGWQPALCAQQVTVSGQVELIQQAVDPKAADASGVVVWLEPLPHATSPDALGSAGAPVRVRLTQSHKTFVPHVLVVQAGSLVDFPNADPFFHNVFSLFEGRRFDLGLYEAGTSRAVKFDRPGICYIFCNIHPEMSAVVVVIKTPYFGMSDRRGKVTLPNVPAGRYELHVWHERSLPDTLNLLTREITVSESSRSLGSLRVHDAPSVKTAHKNKYGRDYEDPTPTNPVYQRP